MTAPATHWQGEPITDDLVVSCMDARIALIGIQADHLRDRWARQSAAYFANKSPAADEGMPSRLGTPGASASSAAGASTEGEG